MIIKLAILVIILYAVIGLVLLLFRRSAMRNFLRLTLILFGVGVFAGIGTYIYVFHKPARNIAKEKPEYVMNAQDLLNQFTSAEDSSYAKYGDKVIQVTGSVADVEVKSNTASIMLQDALSGVNCAFDSITVVQDKNKLQNIKVGQNITLKGKCDGYDMIMGVVLTRCVLLDDK